MTTALTRYRGDTYPDEITVTDETGSAVDITGYTFLLTVNTERSPTSIATQVFQLTGTIVDAAAGQVNFAPSAMQADQTPAKYYFDIQMTTTTPHIKTIAKGTYTFTQDITK